jgi:hypothetical protein
MWYPELVDCGGEDSGLLTSDGDLARGGANGSGSSLQSVSSNISAAFER